MGDLDLFGADNGDQDPVTLPLTAAVRQRKTGLEVGDGSVLKRARAAASSVPASSADQPRQPSLPQAQRASQGAGPQSQADGVGAYGGRSPTLGGLAAGYDTQIANYQKQLAGLSEDPDYAALGEQQRARGQQGVQMLGASIAAGMGPRDLNPLQGQFAQESARMMAPQKIEGGEVDVSGNVRLDPGYKRQKQIESLREAINSLEKQKLTAITAEDQHRITEQQNKMLNMFHMMTATTAQQAALDRAEHARDMAAIARDKLEAKNGPLGVKDAAQIEDRMGDDFRKETQNLRTELDATNKLRALPTDRRLNNIEQQSAVILLNKFLDPSSVVREGEFDRTARGMGLVDRAATLLPKLMRGEFLSPAIIKEIRDMGALYEQASTARIHNISQSYVERSRRRGLEPRNVVGQWLPPEPGAPGAPGAAPNPDQYYQQGPR